MKISTNAIQELSDRWGCADNLVPSVDQLVSKIGEQLGAVEEVTDIGAKYQGAIIVRVVSCVKHENSDHLNVCRVDDAGVVQGVERGEDGLVQVVCGAPNVHSDMLAVWLPPGSTVPDSYDNEPFVLGARELRGVLSNGMLASAKELALGDDHSGILEIDSDKTPGQTFADTYDLINDNVIDIENKMFTHRPDCFGFLGVAREIAGIQGKAFKSPEWYVENPEFLSPQAHLPLTFHNTIPQLVPRFTAITMANVHVAQSPVWLRVQLIRHGLKPINNIVDLTNFYMILTGQPLHAYDYDKVKRLNNDEEPQLSVRQHRPGEVIALLNGKTIEPRAEAIIVTAGDKAIAIGGVMGGSETEVDENTQNIILECANFDMYNIRRTSMAHGLFTDAVTRFNKGQSPYQNLAVLNKIATDISDRGFGVIAGAPIDNNHTTDERPVVATATNFINQRLGISLEIHEIKTLLENVEFSIEQDGDTLHITPPFWRTDISIPEDIVEEVGRLYGFDKLARDLPKRSVVPVKSNELLSFKSKLRHTLAGFGANELLTYSFVHGNLIENTQQNKDLAFKIGNALSPDLQYYRMSLTPSLLNNVHSNIKAGYDHFALFEIGKTHNKLHVDDDHNIPKEYEMLSLVVAANSKPKQPTYFEARNYLDTLADSLGITLEYRVIDADINYPVTNPFEPTRSALVHATGRDGLIGVVGEYKASVKKRLKLPNGCAGFEIGINELLAASGRTSSYRPLSRFPHVSQDICLQVEEKITYADLARHLSHELIGRTAQTESIVWKPIDIYTSPELEGQKRITYRVTLTSYERTLNDEMLSKILNEVSDMLARSLSVRRI